MRTRYGVSPWLDTFPSKRRPEYPRLRGDHTCDVVIVGGGLIVSPEEAIAVIGRDNHLLDGDQ